MNELQLFLLMQNQVMVLRNGMTITSPQKGLGRVKREFKQMMGLKKNCSDAETLQNIGILYAMNGKGAKFNEYMDKYPFLMSEHGIQKVTELSVAEQEAELAQWN
jgi:hypothetical protein